MQDKDNKYKQQIKVLLSEIKSIREEYKNLDIKRQEAEDAWHNLENSSSWRITRPLREAVRIMKHEPPYIPIENKGDSYEYQSIDVPKEWIDMQRQKALISVICSESADSINNQSYKNFETIISDDKISALKKAKGDFIIFIDTGDRIEKDYLAIYIELINEHNSPDLIVSNYDILVEDTPSILVSRSTEDFSFENPSMILNSICIKKSVVEDVSNEDELIKRLKSIDSDRIICESRVLYHYNPLGRKADDKDKVSLNAFYLPQFHETKENNAWWGKGFTEWYNVKRAKPVYTGHDQPRIPKDLGYYDLVEDKSIQYKQIDLAKEYGLNGFCFYYYYFEGKRLLRKPLDVYVENKELDFPYCICWANESWTRRWDGGEDDILMQQVHNEDTDEAFINEMIPMFKDRRYIRVDGKPLLIVYRIELFEYPYFTIEKWREICKDKGVGEIFVAVVNFYDTENISIYGADAFIEFPPHRFLDKETIIKSIDGLNPDFHGTIYSYKKIVDRNMTIKREKSLKIPGCMLRWDNTARRTNASDILAEFDISLFKKWLTRSYYYARIFGNNVMFINAWNEWAEGSYLEPDETYGTKLLAVVREVLEYK